MKQQQQQTTVGVAPAIEEQGTEAIVYTDQTTRSCLIWQHLDGRIKLL